MLPTFNMTNKLFKKMLWPHNHPTNPSLYKGENLLSDLEIFQANQASEYILGTRKCCYVGHGGLTSVRATTSAI